MLLLLINQDTSSLVQATLFKKRQKRKWKKQASLNSHSINALDLLHITKKGEKGLKKMMQKPRKEITFSEWMN